MVQSDNETEPYLAALAGEDDVVLRGRAGPEVNCAGREPPCLAVKRPALPYKRAIQNRCTVGDDKGAATPPGRAGRTVKGSVGSPLQPRSRWSHWASFPAGTTCSLVPEQCSPADSISIPNAAAAPTSDSSAAVVAFLPRPFVTVMGSN